MFGSNVQPKRVVNAQPTAWVCASCRRDNPRYYVRCPDCGTKRES